MLVTTHRTDLVRHVCPFAGVLNAGGIRTGSAAGSSVTRRHVRLAPPAGARSQGAKAQATPQRPGKGARAAVRPGLGAPGRLLHRPPLPCRLQMH